MKNQYNVPSFNEFLNESKKNPFYFKGVNPTVDIIVIRNRSEVLLIKRGKNAATERGKWALPGGFHDTDAKKGEEWKPGKETTYAAALRELSEETGLIVDNTQKIVYMGTYTGNNRDPRDNNESWSSSSVFVVHLKKGTNSDVKGMDDASDAKWFSLKDALKMRLAFDHSKILNDAKAYI